MGKFWFFYSLNVKLRGGALLRRPARTPGWVSRAEADCHAQLLGYYVGCVTDNAVDEGRRGHDTYTTQEGRNR